MFCRDLNVPAFEFSHWTTQLEQRFKSHLLRVIWLTLQKMISPKPVSQTILFGFQAEKQWTFGRERVGDLHSLLVSELAGNSWRKADTHTHAHTPIHTPILTRSTFHGVSLRRRLYKGLVSKGVCFCVCLCVAAPVCVCACVKERAGEWKWYGQSAQQQYF